VALQGRDLAEPFRFRLCFGLEKLPASIKTTEIEIPGMRLAVAIFKDSKGCPFYGRKYSRSKGCTTLQLPSTSSRLLAKRFTTSHTRQQIIQTDDIRRKITPCGKFIR
jgi:hypothetical protein